MNTLDLPQAKLLYIIATLWKEKAISEQQRTSLKLMVINEESPILETLKPFEGKPDEELLKKSLVDLVRSIEKTPVKFESRGNFDPPEQDDLSSPLGNSLFQKKIGRTHQQELVGLAAALRPADDK